uniref:DUF38 domain-containing protein n=1 Tax=Panagrolaimus sp. JU765 TaxID=591449 RepID=A0AC34QC90_9BILA
MYGKLTKNEAKPNGKQFAADHDQKQDVKLCSSLYSDILISSIQQSKSVDVCTKFAMIGQESFVGLVQAFKTIEKLKFHNYQVEFHFGEDNMVYNGSEKFLMKLVQFALPYVKCIEFAPFVGEWFNVVFDILSKESKQKRLEIHRLPVVNDNVKEALTNMVDIGVLIEFNDIEVSVVSVLPPCHFECLTIEVDPDTKPNVKWHFLKYLDCTFRKLTLLEFDFSLINENVQYSWRLPDDFIVGYVQEICFSSAMIVPDDCTIELLNSIKRVFPNVHTLTIDLFPVREYHRGEFEDYIVQIKEAID